MKQKLFEETPAINLLLTYSQDAIKAQKEFITALGPIKKMAGLELENLDHFYARVGDIWFRRWRLHLKDYIDVDFMNHREAGIQKHIKTMLHWAALVSEPTKEQLQRGWNACLFFWEAKYDIVTPEGQAHLNAVKKRKIDPTTGTQSGILTQFTVSLQPRPIPNLKKRRLEGLVEEGNAEKGKVEAGTVDSKDA